MVVRYQAKIADNSASELLMVYKTHHDRAHMDFEGRSSPAINYTRVRLLETDFGTILSLLEEKAKPLGCSIVP